MSNFLRIGLVAEGPLDEIVIRAALNSFAPMGYIMTMLQPEPTRPKIEGGWSGVLKWCHETRKRNPLSLKDDPLLANFDILIIHVDGDVAFGHYTDCGSLPPGEHGWRTLPCNEPCPPAKDTCDSLALTVRSWLGAVDPGDRAVFCIPAMSTGAWLAVAALPSNHRLLSGCPECRLHLEDSLESLPLKERIRKKQREYDSYRKSITEKWSHVTSICSQAERFQADIMTIFNSLIASGRCG